MRVRSSLLAWGRKRRHGHRIPFGAHVDGAVEGKGRAVMHRVGLEPPDESACDPRTHEDAPLHGDDVHFEVSPGQQPLRRFGEGAPRRHVEDKKLAAGSQPGARQRLVSRDDTTW